MCKSIAVALMLALAFESVSAAPKKSQRAKKAQKKERAPAGVATQLPPKRISNESIPSPSMGTTRLPVASILPDSKKPMSFSAAAELSTGQIDSLYQRTIKFTQVVPQLNVEIKDLGTAYMNIPFTHLFMGDNSARTLGRPLFGASRELLNQEGLTLRGHGELQLPFYDSSRGAEDFVAPGDAGRSWGLTAGAQGDYVLGKSLNHLVGGAQLSYDTPSRVMANGANMDLGHPVALRASLGVARHATDKVTVGLGLRIFNELYNGEARGTGLDGQTNALDLSQGEIFGSYAVSPKTRLQGGVVKGLKTNADPLRYPVVHHARDLADFQFNVGLLQAF